MASRPIFLPETGEGRLVVSHLVEFTWHPGLSKSQKQKSIRSLHDAARATLDIENILEISSKSEDQLGVDLSAFNLEYRTPNGTSASVETLFQGSKVFGGGGPFTDLYAKSSREAKKDIRMKNSGGLVAFKYGETEWPLDPQTAFYDWLYISALAANPAIAEPLVEYDGFSDIEFNPKKSINCQAASAALYKVLVINGQLDSSLSSVANFIQIYSGRVLEKVPVQKGIF